MDNEIKISEEFILPRDLSAMAKKFFVQTEKPFRNHDVIKMILKFTGDDRQEVSFITGNYYEAKKFRDDRGEAWVIFDEGYDWYRYGVNFVAENFEEVAEDEREIRRAV